MPAAATQPQTKIAKTLDAIDGAWPTGASQWEKRNIAEAIPVWDESICIQCGKCVLVCPHAAIRGKIVPAADLAGAPAEFKSEHVRLESVKDVQLLEPLFEFSGACAGCGETTYLKLLTQLYGDRLLIANATGCSSIFGGNLPRTRSLSRPSLILAYSHCIAHGYDVDWRLYQRLAQPKERDGSEAR